MRGFLSNSSSRISKHRGKYAYNLCVTVVTTNTRPQRVFFSVETCLLVDVNQPLAWFFTRWPKLDSFTFSRALERIFRRLSLFFCNILLKGLTPLHVKIMSNTNLSSVCWRKLKLSTYLHTLRLQPHIKLFQYTLAVRLSFCYF